MTKYEIIYSDTQAPDSDQTQTLYRIRALKDFESNWRTVKAGELGGYISDYKNLSQEGASWVFPLSFVWEDAVVKDDACVTGWAEISGNVIVEGKAYVSSGHYSGNWRLNERDFPPPRLNNGPKP
jgi:hypothetical protein